MSGLTDPFTPFNHPDLFTMMWVGAFLILFGAVVVYNIALRRYRRYPVILALHEWLFWSILVSWAVVPLLVVVNAPLLLILVPIFLGTGVAAYAGYWRFPPLIAAANDEIRRRRYVPPPRRETRERPRATPAGKRRSHRR